MKQLIAYHGNPAIKDEYLTRVRAHVAADELIKGQYWEDGKGCAVGCTVHGSDHGRYEIELGIPRILARLEDGIFENLPNGHAKAWPEKFLSSIEVGADLHLVWPQFAVWLLADPKEGVIRFARNEKQRIAIQNVADAYASVVASDEAAPDWNSLRSAAAAYAYAYADAAAYAAAYADAYAAAYAAAAYAAAAAAAAYADAAAAAAYADAAAAAAYAAAAARIRQSEKLLELLAAAPVLEAA